MHLSQAPYGKFSYLLCAPFRVANGGWTGRTRLDIFQRYAVAREPNCDGRCWTPTQGCSKPRKARTTVVAAHQPVHSPQCWEHWLSRGNATFIRRLGYDPVTPMFSILCWCRLTDLNRWPFAYKATALPTELNRQFGGEWWSRTTRVAMTVDLQSTPLPLRTNSPKLAMVGGFEPPTSWLTANCSTAELHHQFGTASIYYSTVPIATV